MNEPVDRLIAERERLDAGLPGTVLVSLVAHLVLIGGAIGLPALLPKPPALAVVDGFAVALPRGGGGNPAPPPASAPVRPTPAEPAAPPPAPKVLKPETSAPPRPNALPAPDAKRTAKRPQEPAARGVPSAATAKGATTAGATGTPGLVLGGPPGPGVPTGTETGGDWYLAAVQQKIWMIWNQQIKSGFVQPVGVTFTIQPDGTVTDVKVTQASGASLLDMAAQRAILNAAPFGPLPREHGQNPRTIQAVFRPTS